MVAIGPVVSEEKSFEIVDGRRTTDGRTTDDGRRTTEPAYTISSPGAFGSGELKKELRTGKGHNSADVLQNSVKSHLNMDPKQSSEFQDLSSSNSLYIVLTKFFYFYKS